MATDLSNFDKGLSNANFLSLLYYYCMKGGNSSDLHVIHRVCVSFLHGLGEPQQPPQTPH